ncbi:MAG: hypothetical protein HFJ40_03385 [Clostridia bacterium]|nr:hypothetical protein [Clostridia bacterium]
MSDFNIDENTINKLKDMMNKGDLSDVISQIPPEMIQNVSSMMSSNNPKTNENSSSSNYNNSDSGNKNNTNNFDFSNIDMNTILKMKSVIEKMNGSNDPRSNLLYSLKPYLREEKKEKLDQYANLLNMAKIAELLKNDNKENKNNG